MSAGPADTSEDTRRKRLRFRAWHRGTREADYIIGSFVDRHIGSWGGKEIAWFERLLEETDRDILSWVTGAAAPPAEFDTPLLAAMRKLDYVPSGTAGQSRANKA
ncbi:MAG: succinate dehydrogenase assembly factor 2 [Alphaproteobacteria bacterium]|nr:MAG: succinate dehydrogenase assembly factor 2 [Alphaproteobacteria bacterium]